MSPVLEYTSDIPLLLHIGVAFQSAFRSLSWYGVFSGKSRRRTALPSVLLIIPESTLRLALLWRGAGELIRYYTEIIGLTALAFVDLLSILRCQSSSF